METILIILSICLIIMCILVLSVVFIYFINSMNKNKQYELELMEKISDDELRKEKEINESTKLRIKELELQVKYQQALKEFNEQTNRASSYQDAINQTMKDIKGEE